MAEKSMSPLAPTGDPSTSASPLISASFADGDRPALTVTDGRDVEALGRWKNFGRRESEGGLSILLSGWGQFAQENGINDQDGAVRHSNGDGPSDQWLLCEAAAAHADECRGMISDAKPTDKAMRGDDGVPHHIPRHDPQDEAVPSELAHNDERMLPGTAELAIASSLAHLAAFIPPSASFWGGLQHKSSGDARVGGSSHALDESDYREEGSMEMVVAALAAGVSAGAGADAAEAVVVPGRRSSRQRARGRVEDGAAMKTEREEEWVGMGPGEAVLTHGDGEGVGKGKKRGRPAKRPRAGLAGGGEVPWGAKRVQKKVRGMGEGMVGEGMGVEEKEESSEGLLGKRRGRPPRTKSSPARPRVVAPGEGADRQVALVPSTGGACGLGRDVGEEMEEEEEMEGEGEGMRSGNVMDAVVKVFCVHTKPNYSLPWQKKRQFR